MPTATFAIVKSSSTADILVGELIHDWVVANNGGSDVIRLDQRTNLWGIVKQNLDLLPNDYHIIEDRREYIAIELLEIRQHKTYNRAADREIWINELYRCYISESGQAAIRRYLENQIRATFHAYMVARFSDGQKEMIRHAIGSFLADFNLPINDRIIASMSKDWYRYRQRNTENYEIPIFF